ncbi:MAG: GH3 auxin-responsive promoter family protein [Pseudomonadota bacterium]|nr:GH3 auxin-responsive promoter family protein [Pseudomonadota bacterium]
MIDATPALRAYAGWRRVRLAAEDAAQAQQAQLLLLLRRAQYTRFGVAHAFADIRDVAGFQQRVPLRVYEDFWREWWQPGFPRLTDVTWPGTIPYFAATSGTTSGTTKYIPVSRAMLTANGRAVLDVFTHHLAARPNSRLLAGKNFMLGGSTDLVREAPGVWSGDLSGIAAREVPWWARSRSFPPPELALIPDWEAKIDQLARRSLDEDIRSLSGTPSWVLLFFARLAELRPNLPPRSTSWYPALELFIHGGVSFEPYRPRFAELFAGSRVDMREVYPASEGFIAVADREGGEGMRLIADGGLFYEFVPVDEIDAVSPVRHWLATVEPGVNYAIVLSSCAGLWAYVLGDTVRFVERHPPRLLVTGRLSYSLSAFGEHLIAEEIEAAVAVAAAGIGKQVTDFAVTPVFPENPGQRGGHLFVVEFADPVEAPALAAFAQALDADLCARNADYAAHRAGGFGMLPPQVWATAPGAFAGWMRARGKFGGQNKVPRVITDRALFETLATFVGNQGVARS